MKYIIFALVFWAGAVQAQTVAPTLTCPAGYQISQPTPGAQATCVPSVTQAPVVVYPQPYYPPIYYPPPEHPWWHNQH